MRLKKCDVCGKEFDAIRGNQLTCSAECRKIHNQEYSRANYKKKPTSKPEKKVDNGLAEDNAVARSIGLDYGLYKAYLRIGYLDQYLRIRFHNDTAINADCRDIEKSWIGGCNKANNMPGKVKGYYLQKLTDCKEIKI